MNEIGEQLAASTEAAIAFLQTVPMFEEIDSSCLRSLVGVLERVQFAPNQQIFKQGESGHLLYILVSGRVHVHIDHLTLAELTPGQAFGEMAVFDSQPRSAAVTALENSECWVLSQAQIHQVIDQNPAVAIALIKVLGARLRRLIGLFATAEDLFALKAQA
ncbi:MAG: cyclic nucleotide-binding domain-containing protein [Aphanocapsa sp. GSE-SYN-MK-11-07L]|jgi:CRP-like cAMP-binding protein|nr:cyclic nucleotide-binding domain-containing protein [Aphanocapsa sp. GSE-SYN-MK-11-07L]